MKFNAIQAAFFVSIYHLVSAHGGHGDDGPQDGETIEDYATRHVSSDSKFHLHLGVVLVVLILS